jgi:DNA-directed RNA polymerase subunit RPC12/RpoP
MPTLLIQNGEHRQAGLLSGPVLIGRARACAVHLDSGEVSRVHAWIGRDGASWFVADTFSREGTRVNDQPIAGRQKLSDGDVITVGRARLTFDASEQLPTGAMDIDLASRVWTGEPPDVPIRFVCACGATIAVSSFFIGRSASCTYCSRRIVIPRSSGQIAGEEHTHDAEAAACSICQCAIAKGEQSTRCPTCGVSFHEQCWTENKGCSSYGCAQVNALDDTPKVEAEIADDPTPYTSEPVARQIPWLAIVMGTAAVVVVGAATVGYFLYLR